MRDPVDMLETYIKSDIYKKQQKKNKKVKRLEQVKKIGLYILNNILVPVFVSIITTIILNLLK